MPSVTSSDIRALAEAIAQIDGLLLSVESLADDLAAMVVAYPDQDEFRAAGASTVRAITQIIEGAVEGTPLKHDLEGWRSLHYQSRRAQQIPADMRVVYKERDAGSIELAIFGNRHIPANLYWRMRGRQ